MRGVAATLACFAFIAVLLAWSRWLARRRLASLGHAALAGACTALAVLLWVVTGDLASFDPIRPGLAIAELRFDEAGPGRYRATLIRLPEGRVQVFEMPGDRWRVEARTIDWLGPVASLGMRPSYRLERLESGAASGPSGSEAAGRSYALADVPGLDVWARVRASRFGSRYAEARTVAAPWQPMAGGAEFTVAVDGGRLLVEPAGDSAADLAPLPR